MIEKYIIRIIKKKRRVKPATVKGCLTRKIQPTKKSVAADF